MQILKTLRNFYFSSSKYNITFFFPALISSALFIQCSCLRPPYKVTAQYRYSSVVRRLQRAIYAGAVKLYKDLISPFTVRHTLFALIVLLQSVIISARYFIKYCTALRLIYLEFVFSWTGIGFIYINYIHVKYNYYDTEYWNYKLLCHNIVIIWPKLARSRVWKANPKFKIIPNTLL